MDGDTDIIGRLVLRVVVWLVIGMAGGFLAARKGYSPIFGIVLGVLCGPCGLLVGLFLPRTASGQQEVAEERQLQAELVAARQNKTCPKCGCHHSVVNRFCPVCMFQYPDNTSAEST